MFKIKEELKELRRLARRGIDAGLVEKYKIIFKKLPPLECKVMNECYLNGKSYLVCGRLVSYSERQIKRIVCNSIALIMKELQQ